MLMSKELAPAEYDLPPVDEDQSVIPDRLPVRLRTSQEDASFVVDCRTDGDAGRTDDSGAPLYSGPRIWVERLERGWRVFLHPAEPAHDRHVVAVEMLDDGAITIDPDGAPIEKD